MAKNASRTFDLTISGILAVVLWFSKMAWAFELLILLLAILEFRRLERMRKEFLSEIPHDVTLEIPLVAIIYDKSKFILAVLFVIVTITLSLMDKLNYFPFQAIIFLSLAYYTSFTISYFHQIVYPRKAYLTDSHLHFYHLKIVEIALNEVEEVKLKDNHITFVKSDETITINVKKDLGREKVKDIKYFFTDRMRTEDYGFMYR